MLPVSGSKREAAQAFNKALRLSPDNHWAKENLKGVALDILGDIGAFSWDKSDHSINAEVDATGQVVTPPHFAIPEGLDEKSPAGPIDTVLDEYPFPSTWPFQVRTCCVGCDSALRALHNHVHSIDLCVFLYARSRWSISPGTMRR